MSRIGGVGGGGAIQPEDVDAGQPEPVAPARTSIRPPTTQDSFTGWHTTSVAVAQDAPIATLKGNLNRSVSGTISINSQEAKFVRKLFNRPEEPSRPLTKREINELVQALEREIAAGPANVHDLQTVAAFLKRLGGEPDLPGPIMTMAVGEMGRAVAGMVGDRLKNENDAGLDRTLKAFITGRRARGGEGDEDLSAMIGSLASKSLLDDLAQELVVTEREFTQTHPNVMYYSTFQQLSEAVRSFGSADAKKQWKGAVDLALKNVGGTQKEAKAAGLEVARELMLAVEKGDSELLLRAARKLADGVELRPVGPGPIPGAVPRLGHVASPFVKGRLNAAIARLVEDGKLNDVVEALAARPMHEGNVLNNLHEAIMGVGSKKSQAAWKAAGGREIPTATTMMVGEEGR